MECVLFTEWFRRKVNILRGDSIGHFKKKFRMNMCLLLNGYRDRALRMYKYKSTVKGDNEREITYCLALISCLNDKFVTVHNKCSKIPPSTSKHFVTRVRRSRVVRLSWSSRFFMWAAASKMQANNLSRVSTFFLNFALHPTPPPPPKKKNLTELGLEIRTALSR
jgi:hypothetical protein